MSLQIIVRKDRRVLKETHVHKCGMCPPQKAMRMEENAICQKTLAGSGLAYHAYPCMAHIEDIRYRLGSDWLDAFVGQYAAALATHVIPDAHVDAREAGEIERGNTEIAAIAEAAKKI